MAKSIKISDENFEKISILQKRECRTKKYIIDRALSNYFKAKGINA